MRLKFLLSAFLFVSLIIFSFFVLPLLSENTKKDTNEQEISPTVTIINPIRGSEWHGDKVDLLASLQEQWKAVKKHQVYATWLWQYTALEDDQLVSFAKEEMSDQEFGLFLEIDRNTAQKAQVLYRGQGPLYFSDGLLLASYDQDERRKLIDTTFSKFKNTFGYYPKTVGAWWIGADAISYMQQKYHIVAVMKAADQFDLDAYSIWGGPWSIPYLPSKENQAIPAASFDKSLQVVMIQWAPRDPLKGYADAMYSLQDYGASGYPDYISTIYLREAGDNLNVGLENGGTFEQYNKYYKDKLTEIKKLEKEGKVNIRLVKEYADQFLAKKEVFASSDTKYFLSKSFDTDDQSFWYHSRYYKAGIVKTGETISLIDVHDYSQKVTEDFSSFPNSQGNLRVTTPSVIDTMIMPSSVVDIFKTDQDLSVVEENGNIQMKTGEKVIATFNDRSLVLFTDKGEKQFSFTKETMYINSAAIIFSVLVLYGLVIYLKTRNSILLLRTIFPLFLPFFLALPFFSQGTLGDLSFVFDRKMLFFLQVIPIPSFVTIQQFFIASQIIPFLLLLLFHYLFYVRFAKRWGKFVYWSYLIMLTIMYFHVPYFPLEQATYWFVGLFLACTGVSMVIGSVILYKKTKSKKLFFISLLGMIVVLSTLTGSFIISRTRIVLAPFEVAALETIREKQKDVVLLSQIDYGIKPIYRAVKPLLYEDYRIMESLTNSEWEEVFRPESNVTTFDSDEYRLIFVARYLGGDFSEREQKENNMGKVFDNQQIAIFEKQ